MDSNAWNYRFRRNRQRFEITEEPIQCMHEMYSFEHENIESKSLLR